MYLLEIGPQVHRDLIKLIDLLSQHVFVRDRTPGIPGSEKKKIIDLFSQHVFVGTVYAQLRAAQLTF